MQVQIKKIETQTNQILAFELVDPQGKELPSFQAGAHIDVVLKNGLTRQYSLANNPQNCSHYLIGVLKDTQSRGGSTYIHTSWQEGDLIEISEPRNLFALHPEPQKAYLFAGGIGITPILAMAYELKNNAMPFELHYFAKDEDAVAFQKTLIHDFADEIVFHFSRNKSATDVEQILKHVTKNQHIYVCGPNRFMDFIFQTAQQCGWANENLHKEHFVAESVNHDDDREFTVRLASSQQSYLVPADKTIIEVLEEHDIFIPVSCEQGICGTCITGIKQGIPQHRDLYLSEEEKNKNNQFLPCCSRAYTEELVLDL